MPVDADELGVGIALENSPFGFMGCAADVLAVADAPRLADDLRSLARHGWRS